MDMDNASYDIVTGDRTLFFVGTPETEFVVLPVFHRIVIERRPNACSMLRLQRALLKWTAPTGRVGTGRLIEALHRAAKRVGDSSEGRYVFRVIYQAPRGMEQYVPVLQYELRDCDYAGDQLVVTTDESNLVLDEVTFSVGNLVCLSLPSQEPG